MEDEGPLYGWLLVGPGPRPPFRDVADHLWGAAEYDVDSDGDSIPTDSTAWTELTLVLRPAYRERVDVDPIEGATPLTLWIRSTDQRLADETARFLAAHAGGELQPARGRQPIHLAPCPPTD